jgi:serine/threonine protein phosphatase PrpC
MLKENDKIIILASDGVWEFLSNKEVADIVSPFYE